MNKRKGKKRRKKKKHCLHLEQRYYWSFKYKIFRGEYFNIILKYLNKKEKERKLSLKNVFTMLTYLADNFNTFENA